MSDLCLVLSTTASAEEGRGIIVYLREGSVGVGESGVWFISTDHELLFDELRGAIETVDTEHPGTRPP